ncbi:unnamed protein product [Rhizoctonia solani]|uniref:Gamma tubulin complex component C-terminal domain-containing protein n=1 Tax=Rhizoctonia solani TaxID=456999 RepID=A0A8H2X9A7_9AGAM|nr:unnamed protein product [Rhizoctonia solani]
MFAINSNALNRARFVVPPLKPISLSTKPDDIEVKSPTAVTHASDAGSNQSDSAQLEDEEPDIWTTKSKETAAQNSTFSWDVPVKGPPARSAFLSEQSARVFVAARFHVQPRLALGDDLVRRYISPADLLSSLKVTLLGGTSSLFSWDEKAKFVVRSDKNKPGGTVLVLGELSEQTTASLIEPFLAIGSLIRRIESTLSELRRPSTVAASRALAYSLQSIVGLVQSDLATRLPETLTMASLSRLSTSFSDLRSELDALAELCYCPLSESPPFAELPSTQTPLLDHLFSALDYTISHSAPYRTSAMIAYLLVTSSQDFNNSLAVTIGLVLQSSRPVKSLVSGNKIDLPSFFSERSKLVLESAARALDILRRADPEHPLCQTDWAWNGPDWGWFDKDLHAVDARTQKHVSNVRKQLNELYGPPDSTERIVQSEESNSPSVSDKDIPPSPSKSTETTTSVLPPPKVSRVYKPELAAFSVFDQPPGSHIPAPTKDASVTQFISNGPRILPLSAPTLPILTDATLLALPLAHSRLVSSALFRVFAGRLAFKTHLKVLRGFLLGDDPIFWSRLRGALFEEAGIASVSAAVGRGIRAGVRVRLGISDDTRDQMADERAEREGRSREWGVGLAVGLSDREGAGTWPPGGAELGLRLRHVIDDVLEVGWGARPTSDSDDEESETTREQDPGRTSPMIAYLLVTSSQDFNNSLAVTIGLMLQPSRPVKNLVSGNKIDLPSFFSERSKLVLGSAARALDILRRADPEHPLCQTDWAWDGPRWGWFDKDLHAVDSPTQKHVLNVRKQLNELYGPADATASVVESEGSDLSSISGKEGVPPPPELTETANNVRLPPKPTRVYKPELAAFSVFDQPPGSHIAAPTKGASVAQFISNGPRVLPLCAPTLSLLVDATLLALPLAHSRLVSSALFRVFTGRLAFKTHLKVLRGFLLGDDPVFWSRLRGALFEESGIASAAVGRGIRAGVRVRLGISDATRDKIADERAEREGRSQEWGIGLAVGLSDRESAGTWPPGGAELGLRLRHVIDDALEVGWGAGPTSDLDAEETETTCERDPGRFVLKETSWRLGFILRDLEEESPEGRARWLNPNAIEYVRTPKSLCKTNVPQGTRFSLLGLQATRTYRCNHNPRPSAQDAQNIYVFAPLVARYNSNACVDCDAVLIAGSVETVTRILFNTVFHEGAFDNPPILLVARFKIQSFISSLIGYVKDMAIGSHWDSFLAKLDEIEREDESKGESTLPRDLKKERIISDIFAVHSHLSNTMDQILEACLLRARQRGVGNALKECMEAVLVLCKLVGDRCRQYSSSSPDEVHDSKHFILNVTKVLQRFDKLYNALITALRALDLKGLSIATGTGPLSADDIQLLRRREGESEGVYGRMATWLDPTARCTKSKITTV